MPKGRSSSGYGNMTRYGSLGQPVQGAGRHSSSGPNHVHYLETLEKYTDKGVHYIGTFPNGDRFGIDDTKAVLIAPRGAYEALKQSQKVRVATVATLKELFP
ncbi:MAG: hypothetical protein HY365_03720 [Candidatus Aenigmarchaeota archaeon]|nr:hypothetical protein [Candidatus Aenigmarchaeota archaeon]